MINKNKNPPQFYSDDLISKGNSFSQIGNQNFKFFKNLCELSSNLSTQVKKIFFFLKKENKK